MLTGCAIPGSPGAPSSSSGTTAPSPASPTSGSSASVGATGHETADDGAPAGATASSGDEPQDASVRATGAAFVDVLGPAGSGVVVGGDMRPSSPEFVAAFAEGATRRGANVTVIGSISTDELWFNLRPSNTAGCRGHHRVSRHRP